LGRIEAECTALLTIAEFACLPAGRDLGSRIEPDRAAESEI